MSKMQGIFVIFVAALLAATPSAFSQNENEGQGRAVVTVLPKKDSETAPTVAEQNIQVEINGKHGQVSNWLPLRGPQAAIELVLLIDDGARVSLGREMGEITHFVQNLPPNVRVTLGYMENGRAALSGPFTTDHAAAAKEFHLPLGSPGYDASPYFCLSDLAKGWPSNDPSARREVIMITDGVDYYERRYDPEDPYVQAAITDSARAGLVVYSIYWLNRGHADASWYENNAGQNLLAQVDEATGGISYWQGIGNPVSLQPYFDDVLRRFNNQYELGFTAPLRGKPQVASMKIKINTSNVKVTAPNETWVVPAGPPSQ
jgi:hypothetical protein